MFNLTAEEIKKHNATHTAGEIHHQPEVWKEQAASFFEKEAALKGFINGIVEKHDLTRVIFTGAGTSAFAGNTIVPELNKQNQKKVQYEAIATTDIVSNPEEYYSKTTPTILVSFARSGNSPESVASVALGQQIVDDFYQVIITCNKDGQLANNVKDDPNSITILTPEKANDKSLAMTSSFTTMLVAAYALFTRETFNEAVSNQIVANADNVVDSIGDVVDDVLGFDFERVVYLGSGLLSELAQETALKMLELTDGRVVAINDSSLGFRHGPKSIINSKSLVVLYVSNDAYTRKYDIDILKELAQANNGLKIVALTEKSDAEVEKLADWTVAVNSSDHAVANDFELALQYVIFGQVLAMKKSIQLGITPDNPSPDGTINRVVQGVTIYDYEK